MKNVTEIFNKAISSNTNWPLSSFYVVIDTLKDKDVQVSFWDGEENWASILINDKTVGYIWKKYPLIVLEKTSTPNVKALLTDIKTPIYFEVDSLSEDLLKLDDDTLKIYFEGSVDFNSFTIEDLWFNTNSI